MNTIFRIIIIWWTSVQIASAAAVTLLSAGPVVGDGQTSAEITLWAPRLAPGSKVKVKPAYGRVTDTQVLAGGLIKTTWTPAFVRRAEDVPVRVTVKGTDPIDVNLKIPVVPPHQGEMSVSFDPPLWRPGVADVQVRVKVTGTSPQAATARRILLSANAGTLTEAINSGDGNFVAKWTPPAQMKSSRYVIIGAADAAAPDKIYGWGSLPAHIEQSLSFQAAPGSGNVLKVGSRTYGPVTASPQGTLAFTVSVDPTVLGGQLETRLPDGRTFKSNVDLPLPSYPRVGFLPLPSKLPAGTALPVLAAVIDRDGKPTNEARVMLSESAGPASRLQVTKMPGTYRGSLAATEDAGDRTLGLSMTDTQDPDSPEQRDQIALARMSRPHKVTIEAPQSIGPRDRTLSFTTMVLDTNNMPTAKVASLMVVPGKIYGRPSTKNGKTTSRFRMPSGTSRVTAVTHGPAENTGLPGSRVAIWPIAASVETGATLPVVVAVTDAYGAPVPGVSIKLGALGGGVLPTDATTNESGLAFVDYTAGMAQGLSTLRAEAAGRWSSTTVWQGISQTGPAAVRASDGATRADIDGLANSLASVVIGAPAPKPVAPKPVAAKPKPAPAAPPAPVAKPTPASAPAAAPTPAPTAAAPAPAAAPVAAAPSQPSPSGSGNLNASAALAVVNHVFDQKLEGTSANVPPDVGFSRPASPGIALEGVYWKSGDPLGYAATARMYQATVQLTGEEQSYTGWTGTIGARYRGMTSGINWFGLADLQRIGMPVIEYTDKNQSAAEITTLSLYGVRLGGGITKAISPVTIDALVAQTFALAPTNTRVGLGCSYPLKNAMNARLGFDADLKSGTVEVNKAELSVSETELAITIGISTAL